jgi:hypothetical protein
MKKLNLTPQQEEQARQQLHIAKWADARAKAIDVIDKEFGITEDIQIQARMLNDGTIVNKVIKVPVKLQQEQKGYSLEDLEYYFKEKENVENETKESRNSEKNQTHEKGKKNGEEE